MFFGRFLGFIWKFDFNTFDYTIGLELILPLIHSINFRFLILSSLLFLVVLRFVMVVKLNVMLVIRKMIVG